MPGRRTVAFVDWPHGMRMIDVDRGVVRQLTISGMARRGRRNGEQFVCDTNFPDRGLHTFEVDGDPADDAEFLCASEASVRGQALGRAVPVNDGPVAVEAAQHTHPHPRFSPDSYARGVRFGSHRPCANLWRYSGRQPMTGPDGVLESRRVRQGNPRPPRHRHEPRAGARLRAMQLRHRHAVPPLQLKRAGGSNQGAMDPPEAPHYACTGISPASRVAPRMNDVTTTTEPTTISIAGARVEISDRGRGTPILFLHSSQGITPADRFLGLLAKNRRVIVPSHPGFGHSACRIGWIAWKTSPTSTWS